MNKICFCLLRDATIEPFLGCFCFLEYGVFFIIKLQLIKLKNKKKGCYHLVRMKASGLGKVSSGNVIETFSPLLVNSLERLLNLPGNTLFSQEYQRERISVSLSV